MPRIVGPISRFLEIGFSRKWKKYWAVPPSNTGANDGHPGRQLRSPGKPSGRGASKIHCEPPRYCGRQDRDNADVPTTPTCPRQDNRGGGSNNLGTIQYWQRPTPICTAYQTSANQCLQSGQTRDDSATSPLPLLTQQSATTLSETCNKQRQENALAAYPNIFDLQDNKSSPSAKRMSTLETLP